MKPEVFVSVDIETNGPIPSPFSMLSLGAAAFDGSGTVVSTFTVNLDFLPEDPGGDPDTMREFWAKQPTALWEACRKDPKPPVEAMQDFALWAESLPGKPVCVAYPAGFDWTFVYWYLRKFAGRSPFGFQCLDIKSYAAAHLGLPFRETTKSSMPASWFDGLSAHTHVALEDALEQGHMFMRIRADVLARSRG